MRRLLLTIASCLALLLIAGCGGAGSSSSTTGSSSSTSTTEEKAAEEKKPPLKENAKGEVVVEIEKGVPAVTIPQGPPPKKLVVEDLKKGSGPTAKPGDEVTVHYAGVVYATKEPFDYNWGKGEPFSFELGAHKVIPGWDKGVPGMKVGGLRKLILPPSLAYGNQGVYPSIPPNSTLVFVVELLSAK